MLQGDVLHAVGHPSFRWLAVAAGAAGFLVVGLDAFRQVEVGDEAHVGLVDAHAESDRRAHDQAVLAQEAALVGSPLVGRQAGVVGQCRVALSGQPGGGFLDLLARQAIDDAGLAFTAAEEAEQLLARVVLLDDGVADVRAVEAGQEDARFAQAQALQHLVLRRPVGGGGERDARHPRVAFVQRRQLQVFRAEIVPPLRHAVRFVDGEQGELAGFAEGVEHGQGAVEHQPFGGDVDEVELAGEDRLFDRLRFTSVERRVEHGGTHAELGQCVDLVLHQRDQRRDDDGATRAQQRRNLVAEALAAAGRHQHQGVAATGNVGNDFGLLAAEGGVAENIAQDVEGAAVLLHWATGRRISRCRASPSQARHSPRSSCQSASTQRSTWMPSTMWSWVAGWCVWPWMKVA